MRHRIAVGTAVLVALLLFTSLALANHGDYHLGWWTVDGGGATALDSDDGVYTLGGTIGQADAGTLESNDGSYTLDGGFWAGEAQSTGDAPSQNDVYLPAVIRE